MTYTLPPLPYDYDALEPHISADIMRLHHDKHHQAYVDGANAALAGLAKARETGDFSTVNQLEKNLAFNLGGHINHSVFWTNMAPATNAGDATCTGVIREAIDRDFGSLDAFKAHFAVTAVGIQGSGWAVLGYDQISQKLVVFQLFDQQSNVPVSITPLLMLDMWEHAFYLDYQNVKANYVNAWWNVVNWVNVAERFEAASK